MGGGVPFHGHGRESEFEMSANGAHESAYGAPQESHTSSFLTGILVGIVLAGAITSHFHQKTIREIEEQVKHVEALAEECEAQVAAVTMGRRVQ